MQKTFHFLKWSGKKAILLSVLTIILAVAAIGATLAFIIVQTNPIENTFPPPNLSINIIEGNNIQNDGDVPVYVRAAVVVNWVDGEGAILSEQPTAGDYTLTIADGWVQGADGFYYLATAPAEGDPAIMTPLASKATAALITTATQNTTKTGYTLRVQVLASGIQTTPVEAVQNSWGVTVDGNGNLTPPQATN